MYQIFDMSRSGKLSGHEYQVLGANKVSNRLSNRLSNTSLRMIGVVLISNPRLSAEWAVGERRLKKAVG